MNITVQALLLLNYDLNNRIFDIFYLNIISLSTRIYFVVSWVSSTSDCYIIPISNISNI